MADGLRPGHVVSICFEFLPWGNDPIWGVYFSNGLVKNHQLETNHQLASKFWENDFRETRQHEAIDGSELPQIGPLGEHSTSGFLWNYLETFCEKMFGLSDIGIGAGWGNTHFFNNPVFYCILLFGWGNSGKQMLLRSGEAKWIIFHWSGWWKEESWIWNQGPCMVV